MNEHEITELLQRANPIEVADLPDPHESPDAQRLLDSILAPSRSRGGLREPGPLLARHKLGVSVPVALVLLVAAVATAILARPSESSSRLTILSTRGTPMSADTSALPRGFGRPYVLADFSGRVFFRVAGRNGKTCYGTGNLRGGALEVRMIDCTPFPTATRPVLDEVSVDASSQAGGGKLIAVEGIAADGVTEVRLVEGSGRVLSTGQVNGNSFRLGKVQGIEQNGKRLLAFDAKGNEVWSRTL